MWIRVGPFVYYRKVGDTRQDEGNRRNGYIHAVRKPTVNLT